MDRRLTPANGRVAHLSLRGKVAAERFVPGDWRRVVVPVADLLVTPDGPRDRQFLIGARMLVLEVRDGFAFVQAERDGFVGYLAAAALGADALATHWVSAPATHLYRALDIKRGEAGMLSLGARLTVVADHGRFLETDVGQFVPAIHLRKIGDWASDPVAVAETYLGTPYLWGGNSRLGLDCSGLVQAAFGACGVACPGDSDLIEAGFGTPLGPQEAPRRGDLLFWKGHVAMVAGPDRLIHANGHDMAVAWEPLAAAVARIAAQGGGPVTARKRP